MSEILKKKVLQCGAFFLVLVASIQGGDALSQAGLPQAGEVLEYEITYEWGLIYLRAGDVTFTVKDTCLLDGSKGWHFQGNGQSKPWWDWFYHVNSTYTSIATETLSPLFFSRVGIEGSHEYDRNYSADAQGFFLQFGANDERQESVMIEDDGMARDVMSAVHWCRQLDWNHVQVSSVIPMKFILDGAVHASHVRFLGKRLWEHPKTQEVHRCIVFKPLLVEGTVFKAGEDMTIYVSDDERRLPLFIETQLAVGSARIYLVNHP
ncbi:MAG: DUF3108 domain-containing protein [Flavobacteriales bacterium]|nr:DUF3108 domain-containing protein [Flavobacteriales bacterium]